MVKEDVMTCAEVFKAIKDKSVNIPEVKLYAIIKDGVVEVVCEDEVKDENLVEVKFSNPLLKEWMGVFSLLAKSDL